MAYQSESSFERYLGRVAARLRHLAPERRDAILAELRAHLADAAATEGRDPDDPDVQASVIARLGPARRVGRELAVAHTTPAERETRRRLALGAIGALLSPIVMVLALAINEERVAEVTLLSSQFTLMLVAIAVHVLCRGFAPRVSKLTVAIGLLGSAAFPAVVTISLFVRPPVVLLPDLIGRLLFSLTGVWALLASALLLARHRALAPSDRRSDLFLGPALLGPIWGLAWLVVATNLFFPPWWVLPFWLLNLAVPVWLFGSGLWSIWMSVALLRSRASANRLPHPET